MLIYYLSLINDLEEQKEFERIYYKYKELMYYIAYDVLKDTYMAEDAVQNTFLKIIDMYNLLKFDNENQLKSFICILTKNNAISIYRKRKHELFLDFEKEMNSQSYFAPNIVNTVENKMIIMRIFDLPDIYKDVLILKFFNGFSNKEISNTLEISEINVRKRIERAKSYLKGWMKWIIKLLNLQ